ncbi:hypothetical protein FJZ31_42665 [Candidatus Poribacteria bacterium]|nr:hypothetical protein [Candidatus Poribacteria bacterium]
MSKTISARERKRRQNERSSDNWQELPDGGREYYRWRRMPGADGGASLTVKIVNANEETLEVWHYAWAGGRDPRTEPPDHLDRKFPP